MDVPIPVLVIMTQTLPMMTAAVPIPKGPVTVMVTLRGIIVIAVVI
jgi:hypothetical protein